LDDAQSHAPPSGGTTTCAFHPDREALVRCQRCERTVCPECRRPGPVGDVCVECLGKTRSMVIPARAYLARVGRPYVTYVLIGINVAVWAAGIVAGDPQALINGSPLAGLGGLFGPAVASGQWWRLLTAGFLHSGLIHLGFNMVALYVLGPPMERVLGRAAYLVLYLTALVAGSLGALVASPDAYTVGASGAIFGLMGAAVVGQRLARIGGPASGMIALLVINLVFTIVVPGISIGGHLGGLAGGALAGVLLFHSSLRDHRVVAIAACAGLGVACFVAGLVVAGMPR
jgi:membrane associated rhomboid family serine protease